LEIHLAFAADNEKEHEQVLALHIKSRRSRTKLFVFLLDI
jgi:hypothetical protein